MPITSELDAERPAGDLRSEPVKLVVWDLDETLWHGTLLEGDVLRLRDGVSDCIRRLDELGVLQSIASRNDPDLAVEHLRCFGLADYFLYPQIGWSAKSESISTIVEALNIGLASVVFIDDQAFERDEVSHRNPDVRTLDPIDLPALFRIPGLQLLKVTAESRRRRAMYMEDGRRVQSEREFVGPTEDFLKTLGLRLTIARAGPEDLDRAEELTQRTNQLNSTGITYGREELDDFSRSGDHRLLVIELSDRFGDYGKIGLVLLQVDDGVWTLKLMLVSCRVMSRGVGTLVMTHLLARAHSAGAEFIAHFRPTGRNRMMQVAYRLANFRQEGKSGDCVVYRHELKQLPPMPDYVELHEDW